MATAMAMARHHLLPFTLALILSLLIITLLPSSSHAAQTDALFSDDNDILLAGDSLQFDGGKSLHLDYDCGLVLNLGNNETYDFGTSDDASKNCELRLNSTGQLLLNGDGTGAITYPRIVNPDQSRRDPGYYGLVFVEGNLRVVGPSIWEKGASSNSRWGLEHKSLKSKSTANNFIASSDRIDGNANGDLIIAQNEKVTAYLNANCTVSVTGVDGPIWQTENPTDDPTACTLWLAQNGAFLLQHDGNELVTQWTGGHLKENNYYVAVLQSSGKVVIFPSFSLLWPSSSSPSAAAAATVGKKLKMVTG